MYWFAHKNSGNVPEEVDSSDITVSKLRAAICKGQGISKVIQLVKEDMGNLTV